MSDIVSEIIGEFCGLTSVEPGQIHEIERRIRLKWGGESPYVAKRGAEIDKKRKIINDELIAGRSVVEIERLHGIPRPTIYRIINQRKRG